METTSLYGPILLWHKMLDTVTIRRFRSDWLILHPVKKCREFYSRKWRGRFKFWTLDNLCFHPPQSSWNRYERQEQRGRGVTGSFVLGRWNIPKGSAWCPLLVRVSLHCSGEALVGIMILESICWIRGTGENVTHKRFVAYLTLPPRSKCI